MNKTIIININSIVFHIEEDAYEILRGYMIEIKRHFSQTPDSAEILLDIENRIAEMFSERIHVGRKEVISLEDVNEVIAQMGRVSDFEYAEEVEDSIFSDSREEQRGPASEKKLMRNPDDMVIGGVSSGLGYYFGIQAKWVRILFILLVLFGGSGFLLYVVLWVVMPIASSRADRMAMRGEEPNLQNFKKSFEEKLDGYRRDFSNEQATFNRGARALGSGVFSFFNLFGKGIVVLLLFCSGMVIVGMLITWVGFATGVLGYQNEMVFPGTTMLPTGQALLALTAGVLAITIPFIALFHIFLRLLLTTRPMNNYLTLSLWAAWIVSIILVIAFVVIGVQEYKESSTIKVEKEIEKQEVYYFSEKDIRVIEASALESGGKRYSIAMNRENLTTNLKRDINISFSSVDSLSNPYIQYNYFAKGKTYQQATERASHIDYVAEQNKQKIIFDSHFFLKPSDQHRDQSVSVVVFLPVGSKIVVDEGIENKMWWLSYSKCANEYEDDEVRQTEWIMKRSGLVCAPFHVEQIKKKDKDEKSEE